MSSVLYLQTDGDTVNNISINERKFKECFIGVASVQGKLKIQDPKEQIFLCCDSCQASTIGNSGEIPVLRHLVIPEGTKQNDNVTVSIEYNNIIWLKLLKTELTSVRVYITKSNGSLANVTDCQLMCTVVISYKEK